MNIKKFEYFLENIAVVKKPVEGIVRPVLVESQKQIARSFFCENNVFIKKKRQDGVSTIFSLLIISLLLDEEEKSDIVFICNKNEKKNLEDLIEITCSYQLDKGLMQIGDVKISNYFTNIYSNNLKIIESESFNSRSLSGFHSNFLFFSEINFFNEINTCYLFDFIRLENPKTFFSQEGNYTDSVRIFDEYFKNKNFKILNGEYKDIIIRRRILLEKVKKNNNKFRTIRSEYDRFLYFRKI